MAKKNPPPPIESPAVQPELPIESPAVVSAPVDRTYAARLGRLAVRVIKETMEGAQPTSGRADLAPGWIKERANCLELLATGVFPDGRKLGIKERMSTQEHVHRLDAKIARVTKAVSSGFTPDDFAWAIAYRVKTSKLGFDFFRAAGVSETLLAKAEGLSPEAMDAHAKALTASRKAA